MQKSLDEFLVDLKSVPWFSQLGSPIHSIPKTRQIHDWNEWPGPEDPSVDCLARYLQEHFEEEIEEKNWNEKPLLAQMLAKVKKEVIQLAKGTVEYKENEDAWYAPNCAVWFAAFTAGLVGLHLHFGSVIPAELARQWKWFTLGHWPFGYDGEFPDGDLLIF